MKFLASLIALLTLCLSFPNTAVAQVDPNLQQRLQQGPIIVDWQSVQLFDQIPQVYLDRAANIRMLFSDRSVGQNINEGLDCLTTPSAQASNACKRNHYDSRYMVEPSELFWSGSYNRSNWAFEFKGSSWYGLTQDFVEVLFPQYVASNDIVTYQFSYLNVSGDTNNIDDVANPNCGFLAATNRESCPLYLRDWHVGRILNLENQNPGKVIFYWTASLARSIGTTSARDFNNGMRQWAQSNNKILFDMASIISHTPSGQPCYDNRDGVEYCNTNGTTCENHPDDGINLPAICQHYTTELEGGHLGSASAGKIRVAKGYWVLMAQIAGWQPGTNQPTPTTGPSPTPNPTPTTAPTPTHTPIPSPTTNPILIGDLNGDGQIDYLDYGLLMDQFGTFSIYDFNRLVTNFGSQ